MLKASALYLVIIIALVIGIICSSLIVTAYYYRLQYQKASRYQLLQTNAASAVNILLANQDTGYVAPKSFSLFNLEEDSVSTQTIAWGVFDIGIVRAMIQQDTLYRVFSIGHTIDSSKWAAIYLTDNSRPLSLSGKTEITGDVFISPAGVNQAYVNNQAYSGDKRLITGKKHDSEKTLPELDATSLKQLENLINKNRTNAAGNITSDSVSNSFFSPMMVINLEHSVLPLRNIKLSGNIILFSDTSLVIDSTALLTNVIVVAKSITVHSGFHGSCQLFAKDTIGIEGNSHFNYPSCAGILRFGKSSIVKSAATINLHHNSIFEGAIFIYEQEKSALSPLITIGKNALVKGQVYSTGYVAFEDNAEVNGSVFTDRFLYKSNFSQYENYIINTTINSVRLSPYYLTSRLFPVTRKKKKILQWLETN